MPGKHRVVLVIDEAPLPLDVNLAKPPLKLNVGEWKNWSSECNFRRQDIYDDDTAIFECSTAATLLTTTG